MLSRFAAGAALRDAEDLPHMLDAPTGAGAAQSSCRGGLGQRHLVQSQMRHGPPEPGILGLGLLQTFDLIPAPAATFLAPLLIGLLPQADLTNGIPNRASLSLQHFYLLQLQCDFFGLVSHFSLLVGLLKTGQTCPGGWTNSVGASTD